MEKAIILTLTGLSIVFGTIVMAGFTAFVLKLFGVA